jgi:predicted deacetylase
MNKMIPQPARYLLRFDDLCPTMHRARWQRFLPLIEKYGLRPILAVVPFNQDHRLNSAPDYPDFWDEMVSLEEAGASIALHGYSHLCINRGKSLIPFHSLSEFAGVGEETQRKWIRTGIEILRARGLHPRLWAAPRHGFDRHTLRALRREGIGVLTDGLARIPFRRGGLIWIPQQLWAPVKKSSGVWTICIHSDTASTAAVDELRDFLRVNAAQFTSVDELLAEYSPSRLGLQEKLYEAVQLLRAWSKRKVRNFAWSRGVRKMKAVNN